MLIKMSLQPGEKRLYALSGKYLLARRIEGRILINDADTGLPETEIRQADIIELTNQRQLTVQNAGNAVAVIELQSSTVPIRLNDGGSVTISGGSIDSIRDSIQVEAQATVENGSIIPLSPALVNQLNDVNIPANSAVTIMPANPTAKRRVVILQNISAEQTILRIGSTPAVNAGALLPGSINAIATLEIDTKGEIRARNISATAATVSVMWSET